MDIIKSIEHEQLKAKIPAITKTLMSQTKNYNLDINQTLVKSYILKKAKSTYQQLTVSEDMLQDKTLILQAFPTTFFVDKDGNIVDSIEGSNDYDGWKAKIDEVLEKVMTNE